MSSQGHQPQQQGGLSVQTLLIASAASMAAAIVVHEFWKGGAIVGAAITPVIVAVVSESLRKPVTRVSTLREERRTRPQAVAPPDFRDGPPAPQAAREDPFGIWQQHAPQPWYRRLDRRHLRIALITGALAFAVGAIALTATELVFGGNVGSGSNRVTLVPGGGHRSDDEPTTTTPATGETAPAAPTAPQETEPPAETAPPAETVPPATEAPPATEPAPADPLPGGTPAPEEPGG